jgi:A118 family predicted phage portal protein
VPLPASDNQLWPPVDYSPIFDQMRKWSAWWSNDLDLLQSAYGITDPQKAQWEGRHGPIRHVARVVQRWFVGEPRIDQQKSTKLPVPVGSEICQGSADLLFAEPVTVHTEDEPTQERIDELTGEDFADAMAEGAELAAALGGVYLRATWDDTLLDRPFTTLVDADGTLPEFKFGRMQAVTFWTVVYRDGETTWRHVERHELDSVGVGVILHGLYQGDEYHLGIRVPLTSLQATEKLALFDDLNVEGTINTASEGLAVEYVPNQTPNRVWRHIPAGRYLGRSDLDGVEHLMDELAETMSDWMRARRVARARIALPKSMLQSGGAGQGAVVNPDQEVFTPLDGMLAGKDQPIGQQIQLLQPAFDPAGYKATADHLVEQIVQEAGYSPATFGLDGGKQRSQRTATEVEGMERRTLLTRKRKIRAWTPAIRNHVRKLLALDNTFFNGSNSLIADITVEFPDGVQESQLQLAQTAQALATAEAASTKTLVQMLHPDWDDDQVDEEVSAIQGQAPQIAPPQMPPFDTAPPVSEDGTDGGPAAV